MENLEQKINEFGELSDQIDSLTAQLKKYKSKFSELEDELRPLLEGLQETQQNALQTEKYLITIKRSGYERTRSSYKDAFNLALTKVNTRIKEILNDALVSTETIHKVVSSLGVQKLGESRFTNFLSKFKSKLMRIVSKISRKNKDIQKANRVLAKIAN